ncbi:hypothetical protein LIS04_165 [Listeria phage LIS04]|nr:hypothetical protein LIS04_165 [Listeria phage LIS04]
MSLLTVKQIKSKLDPNRTMKVPINTSSLLRPEPKLMHLEVVGGSLVVTDEVSDPTNVISSVHDFDKLPSYLEDDQPLVFSMNINGSRSTRTYGVVGVETRISSVLVTALDYIPVYYDLDKESWKSICW